MGGRLTEVTSKVSLPPTPSSQIASIYRLCSDLKLTFPPNPQTGLGGKLFYAGEIAQSRNLVYAANIAGAASLAASADPAAQRQAMRDGVVDFLVTSLEEALRILKNEIRKRQTVSVAVAADPSQLAVQMLERGVLPDILPPLSESRNSLHVEKFLAQGARPIHDSEAGPESSPGEFVTWSVDRDFARWLPRLDACAQAVIPPDDLLRQRWLRFAPRYLGRLAQRHHGVALSEEELTRFRADIALLSTQDANSTKPEIQIAIANRSI